MSLGIKYVLLNNALYLLDNINPVLSHILVPQWQETE